MRRGDALLELVDFKVGAPPPVMGWEPPGRATAVERSGLGDRQLAAVGRLGHAIYDGMAARIDRDWERVVAASEWGGACVARPAGPVLAPIARARARWMAVAGNGSGLSPRHQCPLGVTATCEVGALLSALGTDSRRGSLRWDPSSLGFVVREAAHLARADLVLPWSWPAVPVWLSVSVASTTTCRIEVRLRSRHRLRYPIRYHDACHRSALALRSWVEG